MIIRDKIGVLVILREKWANEKTRYISHLAGTQAHSYQKVFFLIFSSLEIIGDMYQDTEAFCHYVFVKFSRSEKIRFVKFPISGGGKSGKSGRLKNCAKKNEKYGKTKLSDKNGPYNQFINKTHTLLSDYNSNYNGGP